MATSALASDFFGLVAAPVLIWVDRVVVLVVYCCGCCHCVAGSVHRTTNMSISVYDTIAPGRCYCVVSPHP